MSEKKNPAEPVCHRCENPIIRGDQYDCSTCGETFCYLCLIAHTHKEAKKK